MSSDRRASLVDGKNNSRAAEPPESEQSTLPDHLDLAETGDDSGRYDCRSTYRNFRMQRENGDTAPYRCNSWDCYCCAHRMRMNLIEELDRLVEERPEMRRLLTLTISPETAPAEVEEQHAYITDRWNALRTELRDQYPDLSFVWIRHEGDENGRPHLHLLVDRFLPQSAVSMMSERVGLGEVVDIRRVNARNAARYLTSYLGKGALATLPAGLQRYGSSSDISLNVRGSSGDSEPSDWTLVMDDFEVEPVESDGPLTRPVAPIDFVQQRERGGPVGLDPPPE